MAPIIPASFERDRSQAYALARICFGTNIALHGLVRLTHLNQFVTNLQPEFAKTFLPGSLVEFTGYVIVFGEAIIGLLVLFGFGLRSALIAGQLLMLLLLAGTCLREQW
ncbi:MAG: DoxX family membrane protein, partial [Opitutaceae bacterium]